MQVEFPMRLVSLLNVREHWAVRAKRAKKQRETGRKMLAGWAVHNPPLTISITRISPRPLDSDNLAASAKHVRDGIADALGIDDGSPLLTWKYYQEKPHRPHKGRKLKPEEKFRVRINIRTRREGDE